MQNLTTNNPNNATFYATLITDTTSDVVNVQWCQNNLYSIVKKLGLENFFGGDSKVSQSEQDAYNKENPDKAPLNSNRAAAELQKLMDFMGTIEEKYYCSGICYKEAIFFFSDVNNGLPIKSCQESLKDSIFKKKLGNYGIGLVVIAALLCIPWLLHFSLYCLPGNGSITNKKTLNII